MAAGVGEKRLRSRFWRSSKKGRVGNISHPDSISSHGKNASVESTEHAVSKPQSFPGQIAALVLELGTGTDYPEGCNAHILPDGLFRSDDGRPASLTNGALLDWKMDAAIAAALIAALEKNGKPILYDYEHNSLYGDSIAAGWIDRLVYVAGRGLFAHVDWVDDAAEAITKKKYRYSSPCFLFDPKTGAVIQLLSVALTNNPALGDLGAVDLVRRAALSAIPVGALANLFLTAGGIPGSTMGDLEMTPEQLAALTTERDSLKTSMTALTAECATLKTTVANLTTERDKATADLAVLRQEVADKAAADEKAKHADLLAAALKDGRLPPAQKPWAEKRSLAELTEYLEAVKPLSMLNKQTEGQPGKPGAAAAGQLSEQELAMCKRMGVTPEDFLKARG
jgi:phage I-like protein